MFYLSLDHSVKRYKCTHVSSCKLPVGWLNSSLLFPTNQSSALFLLGLSQSILSQVQTILPKLTDTIHSHHLHHPGHSFPAHQVLILMEPYWQLKSCQLQCGSKTMSLPDGFQSTTSTLDSPGFNSVVFPRMNMFLHLEDGSTNT